MPTAASGPARTALEAKAELRGHSFDHNLVEVPIFGELPTLESFLGSLDAESDAMAGASLAFGTGLAADLPRHILTHLLDSVAGAVESGLTTPDAALRGDQLVPLLQVVYALASNGLRDVWSDLDELSPALSREVLAHRMSIFVSKVLPPQLAQSVDSLAPHEATPLGEAYLLSISLVTLLTSDRETVFALAAEAANSGSTSNDAELTSEPVSGEAATSSSSMRCRP